MIRNIGLILLAVYLICVGVGLIWAVVTPAIALGILAIAAAVFILLGK